MIDRAVGEQKLNSNKEAKPCMCRYCLGVAAHQIQQSQPVPPPTPAVNNGTITLNIADFKELLKLNQTQPQQKKKKLSCGQRKRLARAAENKLKKEMGLSLWWQLQVDKQKIQNEAKQKKEN